MTEQDETLNTNHLIEETVKTVAENYDLVILYDKIDGDF